MATGLALQAPSDTPVRWTLFAGIVLLLLVAITVLTHKTAQRLENGLPKDIPTHFILVNLVVTHGTILLVVAGGAVLAGVPGPVFGALTPTPWTLTIGVVVGVSAYGLAEGIVWLLKRRGVRTDRRLTTALEPRSWPQAVVLGGVAFPVAAAAEEVLYRGAMIGALGAGLAVPEWLLLFGSAIAFGAGHSLQGWGGVLVASALGLFLGGAFLATGSLLAVIVAHYVVNMLEVGGVWIRGPR